MEVALPVILAFLLNAALSHFCDLCFPLILLPVVLFLTCTLPLFSEIVFARGLVTYGANPDLDTLLKDGDDDDDDDDDDADDDAALRGAYTPEQIRAIRGGVVLEPPPSPAQR